MTTPTIRCSRCTGERVQEREVRLAAQRILATHLRRGTDPAQPADSFWADLDLDLTGATLIDLDFTNCQTRTARFTRTHFIDGATFNEATFVDAWFDRAEFTGLTRFERATFTGRASFDQAQFTDGAAFIEVQFTNNVPPEVAPYRSPAADAWQQGDRESETEQ